MVLMNRLELIATRIGSDKNAHLMHILACGCSESVTICSICGRIARSAHWNLAFGALGFLDEHLGGHFGPIVRAVAACVWMLGWLHLQRFQIRQHRHHCCLRTCSFIFQHHVHERNSTFTYRKRNSTFTYRKGQFIALCTIGHPIGVPSM